MALQTGNIIWSPLGDLPPTLAVCLSPDRALYLCPKKRKIIETAIGTQYQLHATQPDNLPLAAQTALKYKGLDSRLFDDSAQNFIGTILKQREEPKAVFKFLLKALGNGAMLNSDRKIIMAISSKESAQAILEATEHCPVNNEQVWASLQKGIRFYS